MRDTGAFPSGRLSIARWLEYQRPKGNARRLASHQLRLLNQIGMVWKFDIFEKRLAELKAFYAKHGHSNVPWNYPENPGLGHYVCNALRSGKERLSRKQIQELNALNFVWDIREEAWRRHFAEFKEFLSKHSAYPTRITDPSLASWVRSQRKITQSQSHIDLLNSIDFAWSPLEENWLKRYSELRDFQKRFGHCRVPSNIRKFHQLWDWLNYQKKQRFSMSKKRHQLLDKIKINWTE